VDNKSIISGREVIVRLVYDGRHYDATTTQIGEYPNDNEDHEAEDKEDYEAENYPRKPTIYARLCKDKRAKNHIDKILYKFQMKEQLWREYRKHKALVQKK